MTEPVLDEIDDALWDEAWLKEREIEEPWPVGGLPDSVHVDNGADFRSRAFKRGCENAGIAIDWRPPSCRSMSVPHSLQAWRSSNARDLRC